MFRLCLLVILLHQAQCQDYLTCVRNNDAFSGLANQHTPSNNRGPTGYPGKKGVSGAKGDVGMKGSKGEVGETNRVSEERFRELQDIIANNAKVVLALEKKASQFCQVAKEVRLVDWYRSSNGYHYKLSTTSQTWQESRRKCQEMGGELAFAGVKASTLMREVSGAIFGSTSHALAWIGMSDREAEGNWKWVDGSRVNSRNLWLPGEPSNSYESGEDCATTRSSGMINDVPCIRSYVALCEKTLENLCN